MHVCITKYFYKSLKRTNVYATPQKNYLWWLCRWTHMEHIHTNKI